MWVSTAALETTLEEAAKWVGSRNARRAFAEALAVPLRRYRRLLRLKTPRRDDADRPPGRRPLFKAVSIQRKVTFRGTAIAQVGWNVRKTATRPGQRISKVLGLEYGNRYTEEHRTLRDLYDRHEASLSRDVQGMVLGEFNKRIERINARVLAGTARVR